MPREPRSDYPGALHHVMVRGIERRPIFMDDVDRSRFLMRMEASLVAAGTGCLAWALMPNHVHLYVRTGPKPLAVSMHMLGTSYAMDFNRRYERVGHLFQNRYKALAVESDAYHLELIRYIHLNPVRAGIVPDVDSLEDYPWTGHRALMGRAMVGFQAVGEVLDLMARDPHEARSRLRKWMKAPLPPDRRRESPERSAGQDLMKGERDGEAPGIGECPGPVTPGAMSPPVQSPRWIRANRLRQEGWDLPRLTRAVCGRTEVPVEELRAGRRTREVSRARAVVAWFAWADLAVSQRVLATYLGVSGSALSARMELGRLTAKELGIDPFQAVLRPPGLLDFHRDLLAGRADNSTS